MVGNVWEWVSDLYAPYSSAAQVDPQGDASGTDRVIRGGGWNGEVASWVRPTFRYHDTPSKRSHGIGFRCAKPIDDKAPTDPKDTE
jgi:formylglycine-generating enzyme required for sulfatase activity